MKNLINKLSLIIIITLSIMFVYPKSASALSQQTRYISVKNQNQTLNVGHLSLYNLSFKDYSTTSTKAFGITGLITNNYSKNLNYTLTTYYYDENYNLLAETNNNKVAVSGTSDFNQMFNLDILNGHNVSEICYYRLLINYEDVTNQNDSVNIKPSQNSLYSYYDYVIDKYDINIIVNENNTLDITENITANFKAPKHGIFRTIPLENQVERLDGTISTNRTQISNVTVDSEYKATKINGDYKLQIGSSTLTVTGEKSYEIKYTYNLGKDPIKDYDELYYNIIGTGWDTVIGNVTFSITMPKDFDSSKLGFSSGIKGSTTNNLVNYNVKGRTVTGSYNGVLNPGEALTVRLELDDGYFVGAGLKLGILDYLMFILPTFFLLIAFFVWYKYGRDKKVIETVEFYPPAGFNSLDIGFLYKGKADKQDVISLLIYLANKGYIKISETEQKTLFFKNKGFKITKLKEYDGNDSNEKLFLNGLFKKHSSFKSLINKKDDQSDNKMDEVTSFDLYDNFYITIDTILSNVNTKENKDKILEKTASNKTKFIILMIVLTYIFITVPPVINYGGVEILLFALLFPGIGFSFLFYTLLFSGTQTIYINGQPTNSAILTKVFGIVWGLGFGGMPWTFLVLPILRQDPMYLIGYMIGLACILGMIICIKCLPKRTQYGNEMLGKIRGFKHFLETAEKPKLEAMVMQDPTYFYNILPYTYVLGVSDKWIKKFETISLQAPSWYDSPNAFNVVGFGYFMHDTMASAKSAMTSSPSSSSSSSGGSSSSSSGGFSGGGSGGGGGGSW